MFLHVLLNLATINDYFILLLRQHALPRNVESGRHLDQDPLNRSCLRRGLRSLRRRQHRPNQRGPQPDVGVRSAQTVRSA